MQITSTSVNLVHNAPVKLPPTPPGPSPPVPPPVNWVITVTEIEIPKSRNFSTYPAPPLSTKHTTWNGQWLEEFSRHCPHRQTDTMFTLIYKIEKIKRRGWKFLWTLFSLKYKHTRSSIIVLVLSLCYGLFSLCIFLCECSDQCCMGFWIWKKPFSFLGFCLIWENLWGGLENNFLDL